MSNVHLHLHVGNVEASRAFYERFFGGAPVKLKSGYAKFLPEFAPINLALSEGPGARGGTVNHLGVQVESREMVGQILERVKQAGIPVREEMGVDCCYANQDKFWVTDPDGVEWEVYHLNYDLEEEAPVAAEAAKPSSCCTPKLSRIGKTA